jgi:hypothetical protein
MLKLIFMAFKKSNLQIFLPKLEKESTTQAKLIVISWHFDK